MADQQTQMGNSAPDNDVDIAIIGAGMVGMALACALGDSGLRVVVIESQPHAGQGASDQPDYDPRVSALTLGSQRFLQRLGAWEAMTRQRVCAYQHMRVWDGEGTAGIGFSAAELAQQSLGHIVENRVTLAALEAVALRHENIDIIRPASLRDLVCGVAEGDWHELELSTGRRLRSRLLVAADGARSRARQLAGLGVSEWDYEHSAIVTTVTTERPHQYTAWQRFTEDGPLAFLPLPGGSDNTLSIVWSTSPDHARALMALDSNAFNRALEQAFESRLGRIEHSDPRYCFPLTQRHAPRYVQEGVALVGDAAHTIHPLAGQGVNLGLADACELADQILRAVERGRSFSALTTLRRYQRARQGENLAMIGLMAAFRHLYGEVPPLVHWLRNLGMSWVDRQQLIKRYLAGQGMGL